MAFVPDTIIHLLATNIDNSYKNQITFTSEYNQANYFLSKKVYTDQNLTYQRKDNVIMWNAHIDTLYKCNYCMYRNSNFTNKWFYAFISKMEYINDSCTAIQIETDVWQTWYFDIDIRQSFVEREHVSDDTIGLNLNYETFETGDYIINGDAAEIGLGEMMIVLAMSSEPNGEITPGSLEGGVYTGVEYLFFDATISGVNSLNNIITGYSNLGQLDAIVAIFMCPKRFLSNNNTQIDINIKRDSLDGYTPRNNKLLSSPFIKLSITNNNGLIAEYNPEDLNVSESLCSFMLRSALSMQAAAIVYPLNYKGAGASPDDGIVLSGFPQCSWVGNVFANWLAQNQMSLSFERFSSAVSGVASGNLLGAGTSITSSLIKQYEHSLIPPQLQGQAKCDSANVTWDRMKFTLKQWSIRKEYAQKIDEYFTRYGYLVARTKIPNIIGRPNWNFVKTQECVILGSIPNEDMFKLKSMFNNGVTFWHNGDIIGQYNLPNEIGSTPIPPPDPPPEPEPPEGETMQVPVSGGMTGITSEFGWRDYPPDPYHTGIDFARAQNTPINAALSGKILWVKIQTTGFGKHIKLDHGNGLTTMYAHCNSISATQGQIIAQGTEIAKVGTTGLSTGNHLHFQVEVNGTPVNPRNYLT